jgi:LysR family cyn operon transcriptional activator
MELRQLRYLLAIAEEGNFTRAAEKVFVSQSALSQQIQLLEQEIGAPVLSRGKRGVHLTAAGEVLKHHALRVFHELEQARVVIDELQGLKRGELRVGAVQTVNDYLMPHLITAFAARYPDVKVRVDELPSDDIEAGLESGGLQAAIGFIPASRAEIAHERLFSERLALVVRADHPLAGKRSVQVAALDGLPVIMLANTFCTRRLWEESARLASAQPRVVLEVNTVSSILSLVETTGLASVLPEYSLRDGAARGLIAVALTHPTPVRQVGLLWRRDESLCAATRAFMSLAREVTQKFEGNKEAA